MSSKEAQSKRYSKKQEQKKDNGELTWKQLTPEEIKQIQKMRQDGETLEFIAKKFNRSIRTIEKHTKN